MTSSAMPALVVPMRLTALCVGAEDMNGSNGYGTKDFEQLAADFSVLPYIDQNGNEINPQANIAEAALPELFASASDPLQPGIHVHWSLPSALAHGVTDGSSHVQFPKAPNRWLVIRVAVNPATGDPSCAIKALVIESDLLWDRESDPSPAIPQNLESRAVPISSNPLTTPNKSFRTMGKLFQYETWQDSGSQDSISPFTVLGYGIADYGGVYAHSRNVFALHDTLDDLDPSQFPSGASVTYHVIGWYANPADDPLNTLQFLTGATCAEKLAQLEIAYQWTFQPAKDIPFPSTTFCSGVITTIPWNPATSYIQKRPPEPFQIAIGNTAAEALSALLAAQPDLAGLDRVERVLNALQMSQLPYLSTIGGLGQFDELLHSTQFGATPSGHIWIVKRNQTAPNAPLPQKLGADLSDLNVMQRNLDEGGLQLESLRGQLFADWYKYMIVQYPPTSQPSFPLTADQAFDFLRSLEVPAILSRSESLTTQSAAVDKAAAALQSQLPDGYALAQIRAPRYWQPVDPVILVAGTNVQGPNPPARPTECRLTTSLVNSMSGSGDGWTVHASDVPQLPAAQNSPLRGELEALFADALFLNPDFAAVLANLVVAEGAAVTAGEIQTAQTAFLSKSGKSDISFAGVPSAPIGVAAWTAPWTPLIAQWEIYYYPNQSIPSGSGSQYSPVFITSNYLLDPDGIELDYQPGVPNPLPEPEIYRGTMVWDRGALIDLTSQIEIYRTTYPDSKYSAELAAIQNDACIPAVAQALGGFNQALAMRKQTLQLAVADPLAILSSFLRSKFINEDVKSAVGAQNRVAAFPENPYNPLRAGFMKLSRLRIVDSFGQVEDLVDIGASQGEILNPPIVRAETMLPQGDYPNLISLAPRLVQPSRVLFRWCAAEGDFEMNSDPSSTPIFGWVLFNHLDDGLAIYDADGNALGSLNARGPIWQGAPGNNATYNQSISDVFENANPHLRNFALGIYNPQSQAFIADLLRAIDRSVTLIQPPSSAEFSGVSLLVGRPLALVRASLELDIKGLPAWDQSWDAFAATVQSGSLVDRSSAGFMDVAFPVRLGDLSQVDDGLIGYAVDAESGADWNTFYAAASDSPNHGVVPPPPNLLTLTSSPARARLLVSMLIDPRAAVHATMGCLPVKQIRIPPQMFADALRHISVTFLTTPVLGTPSRPLVPVPKENGCAWSWVTRKDDGAWEVFDDLKPIDANAQLADTQQQISEGWLKLTRSPDHG